MISRRLRRLEVLLERLAAVVRGHPTPAPRRLQTAQDIVDLLQDQIEAIRLEAEAGTLEKARAIGYLAGIARKAIETGTLAARLEMLEAVLKQRNREAQR